MRRYLSGAQEAANELVEKFSRLVWAIVWKTLRQASREEREDCYQDAWIRIFAGVGTWKGECPFCRWLEVVTVRCAIDRLRRNRVPPGPLEIDPPAPPMGMSLEALETNEKTIRCILRTAAGFPTKLLTLFLLDLQGEQNENMARIFDVTPRTIQLWLRQMRERLRHCLEE